MVGEGQLTQRGGTVPRYRSTGYIKKTRTDIDPHCTTLPQNPGRNTILDCSCKTLRGGGQEIISGKQEVRQRHDCFSRLFFAVKELQRLRRKPHRFSNPSIAVTLNVWDSVSPSRAAPNCRRCRMAKQPAAGPGPQPGQQRTPGQRGMSRGSPYCLCRLSRPLPWGVGVRAGFERKPGGGRGGPDPPPQ